MPENRTNPIPFILAFIGLVIVACLRQQFSAPKRVLAPKAAVAAPRHPEVSKPETGALSDAQAPAKAAPRRVVLVTVDGWHVRLTDRMPVWSELTAAGSWTLNAEVPKGATTVISHAALYSGADPSVNGISREPRKEEMSMESIHGVATRWIRAPLKVKDTIFTATEAAGHKAVAVVQKGKLVVLLRPDNDETRIRISGDAGLLKAACEAVADDATRLVVLHVSSPDGAGHAHGWLSDEQYRAAGQVSALLQKLRSCIADAEAAGGVPTTLIVTSDHGGTTVDACMRKRGVARCGHGADDADNRRVPWVAIGPGIKAGHEIRADVRLVDTAPTLLRILGLPNSSIPNLSGVEISEIFSP